MKNNSAENRHVKNWARHKNENQMIKGINT